MKKELNSLYVFTDLLANKVDSDFMVNKWVTGPLITESAALALSIVKSLGQEMRM